MTPANDFNDSCLDVIFSLISPLSLLSPPKASIDWTCLLMNLLRNCGRNSTLLSRTHKALAGWISSSAAKELDWHYFHENKTSCADLGLKLPVVWQMKGSHTTFALLRHTRRMDIILEWQRFLIFLSLLKFTKQKCKNMYTV